MSFFTQSHEAHKDAPTMGEMMKPHLAQVKDLEFQGQVKSVSYSTMSSFEQCPYRVYLSKVHNGGIKPLGSPAMDRGSEIHQMLEDYVNGEKDFVDWLKPKSKDYYVDLIEQFREGYVQGTVVPELAIAIYDDLTQTTWEDPKVWLRGAIDVAEFNDTPDKATHANLYDYKTGSDQGSAKHRTQLQLYALLMLQLYPNLQTVKVAAIYLDHRKDLFFNEYTRSDIAVMWPRFYQRLKKITDATTFFPEPNGYNCKWCQHKKEHPELNQDEPACKFA